MSADRASPLWQLLLRDAPELADMTDDEVRALIAKSKGPGPTYSREDVIRALDTKFESMGPKWRRLMDPLRSGVGMDGLRASMRRLALRRIPLPAPVLRFGTQG